VDTLDVVRIGDFPEIRLSVSDPQILDWAERENRIFVSQDRATLVSHLQQHLSEGKHSPGVFLVRQVAISTVIEFLVCAAYASEASEWADRITFIP